MIIEEGVCVLAQYQIFRFTKKCVAVGVRNPLHKNLLGYFLPYKSVRKDKDPKQIVGKIQIEKDDVFRVDMAFDDGVGWRVVARRISDGVKVWFYQYRGIENGDKFLEVAYL